MGVEISVGLLASPFRLYQLTELSDPWGKKRKEKKRKEKI